MIVGPEATLNEVLAARDWRAARQRALGGQTVVCLTLNIAGPVKRFPLADRAFAEARRMVALRLGDGGAPRGERIDGAGHCALFVAGSGALAVKRQMCGIELGHPIGRLFDIDVIGPDGTRIGREAAGLPARACLLCDQPAHACARSRAHPVEAVQAATGALLKGYFDGEFADAVQRAALRALLYELSVTPKPGLVDRANSGAHRDMDYLALLDSIAAIARTFRLFALKGMEVPDDQALLAQIQSLGIRAEADMLEATGGANAHRGAIFALGLIAAACGRLYARGEPMRAECILDEAAPLGALAFAALRDSSPDRPRSHGERAFAECGAGGARAEAMRGYPSVRDVALPALREWLRSDASPNDAGVAALLALIGHVEDTNLIARAGADAARAVREDVRRRAAGARGSIGALLALAAELDGELIKRNLSPGGCADLLAAAWMVHLMEEGER